MRAQNKEDKAMQTHMDRAIFHLKASVTATSLYILICAMLDEGRVPTLDGAKAQWTGTEENLLSALQELTQRGILEPVQAPNGKPARLDLSRNWRRIV